MDLKVIRRTNQGVMGFLVSRMRFPVFRGATAKMPGLRSNSSLTGEVGRCGSGLNAISLLSTLRLFDEITGSLAGL